MQSVSQSSEVLTRVEKDKITKSQPSGHLSVKENWLPEYPE